MNTHLNFFCWTSGMTKTSFSSSVSFSKLMLKKLALEDLFSSSIFTLLSLIALYNKPNAIQRQTHNKIKNTSEESRMYGRSDTVDTGIFTKAEVEEYKRTVAELKRQKQKLQDTLLELNIQTEIQLDVETARFLERADIL